jgi:transcriptional regulator with XRE-family HTH domain
MEIIKGKPVAEDLTEMLKIIREEYCKEDVNVFAERLGLSSLNYKRIEKGQYPVSMKLLNDLIEKTGIDIEIRFTINKNQYSWDY